MTEDLKTRITRVAQIAQRNARNHEDQVEAQALIDEMAAGPGYPRVETDPVGGVGPDVPPNRATTDAEQKAFADGRDAALANAAMLAHDMGHPDVRKAINRLMPDGSPHIPMDDERNAPTPFGFPSGMGVTVAEHAETPFVSGPPVAGANVELTRAADVVVATAPASPEIPTGDWKFGTWQGPVTAPSEVPAIAEANVPMTTAIGADPRDFLSAEGKAERLREKGKGSKR